MIHVTQSPMTVADYCQALNDKTIMVNRNYQRSWEVWPPLARSFLIETIVLGYPVPKLYLHQILDLRSRKTIKEIVDGQQRTVAIQQFFTGGLRLSSGLETEGLAGHTYEELEENLQEAFLSYSLAIDLFVGATPEEIREVFRRMNSYTVPLNPEEDRHAGYQGHFKWYIYRLSRALEGILGSTGIFTQREFVRMQDAKLLTEITHAMHNGITTTNKRALQGIYKTYDTDFPKADRDKNAIVDAFYILNDMDGLHNGPLMKSFVVYSLILAIIHHQMPLDVLSDGSPDEPRNDLQPVIAFEGLQRLAGALEEKEDYRGPFREFVGTCLSRTNVKTQRTTRFTWLYRALNGTLPAI